jgi:hypothetical protein
MGKLLSMLEAESRNRGLIRSWQTADAKAAFALLRDMPYQRASTREPEAIIQEGRGTCSGKRYFLDQIFREEGLESRVIMCTHRFTKETTADSLPELGEAVARCQTSILISGPIPKPVG